MVSTPLDTPLALHLDPVLAQHWVSASRSLAQLSGYLEASALTEVWGPLLRFVEGMEATCAQGLALDVATLARDAVLRPSARSAPSRDALQRMAAQAQMEALSGRADLTLADLDAVQSLLGPHKKGGATLEPSAELARWLLDWHQAAQTDAQPDVLLQWPRLHARWQDLRPTHAGHLQLGHLLSRLLLQRAGLMPSMAILWSRASLSCGGEEQAAPTGRNALRPLDGHLQMLKVLNQAAQQTLKLLSALSCLWSEVSHAVQAQHKFYAPELIRHLFLHPASRVDLLARDMVVTRLTATRYLDALVDTGILQRERLGRDNIYAHGALQALIRPPDRPPLGS